MLEESAGGKENSCKGRQLFDPERECLFHEVKCTYII